MSRKPKNRQMNFSILERSNEVLVFVLTLLVPMIVTSTSITWFTYVLVFILFTLCAGTIHCSHRLKKIRAISWVAFIVMVVVLLCFVVNQQKNQQAHEVEQIRDNVNISLSGDDFKNARLEIRNNSGATIVFDYSSDIVFNYLKYGPIGDGENTNIRSGFRSFYHFDNVGQIVMNIEPIISPGGGIQPDFTIEKYFKQSNLETGLAMKRIFDKHVEENFKHFKTGLFLMPTPVRFVLSKEEEKRMCVDITVNCRFYLRGKPDKTFVKQVRFNTERSGDKYLWKEKNINSSRNGCGND